jgi:redox-sensitive bicupin YhaK (pirin superfamily)
VLDAGERVSHELRSGRHAWVQVARGTVQLDGSTLSAGDGAAISEPGTLALVGRERAEVLLFDLP